MTLRKKKLYNKPKRSYDKPRIEEENVLVKKYGLKNKREIWRADFAIGKIRNIAKELIKASPEEQQEFIDRQKAKGMREGIAEFSAEYPKYGRILNGMIEQQRTKRETHMYFGMHEGKRLTQDDYMAVMQDLGLSEQKSEQFYPVVMEISRNLTRKRAEKERSVMIG